MPLEAQDNVMELVGFPVMFILFFLRESLRSGGTGERAWSCAPETVKCKFSLPIKDARVRGFSLFSSRYFQADSSHFRCACGWSRLCGLDGAV